MDELYYYSNQTMLIPDKIDSKTKTVAKDNEGHYINIMIMGLIQQEDITLVNICTQHRGT